jgi:hypothetical protein
MSQSALAKAPVILGVSITNRGENIRVRFQSPTFLPTVFTELKYVVPKEFNTTFDKFLHFNGKDAVFTYLHPTQLNMPVIFSSARIVKTHKPSELKPTFTIHLTPNKDDPFLSPE